MDTGVILLLVLIGGLALVVFPWGSSGGPIDRTVVATVEHRGRLLAIGVGVAVTALTAVLLLAAFASAFRAAWT